MSTRKKGLPGYQIDDSDNSSPEPKSKFKIVKSWDDDSEESEELSQERKKKQGHYFIKSCF